MHGLLSQPSTADFNLPTYSSGRSVEDSVEDSRITHWL